MKNEMEYIATVQVLSGSMAGQMLELETLEPWPVGSHHHIAEQTFVVLGIEENPLD
jgi:hypothetical protein